MRSSRTQKRSEAWVRERAKMRKKVAIRRKMNLDESIITKLVIFERCAGKTATKELYNLIDKENGTPEIFTKLEDPENKECGLHVKSN